MIARSDRRHSSRIAGSSCLHAIEKDPIDPRVVCLEQAESFDRRDPAVLKLVHGHDPGEQRGVLRPANLAKSATGLDADDGVLDIVGRLDDLMTSTAIAQVAQASDDDRTDGHRLLGLSEAW